MEIKTPGKLNVRHKFFKNSSNLKKKITENLLSQKDAEDISAELDALRDKVPFIYNIETTNYCNMKCVMCPRTMFMTRKNIWINDNLFDRMTSEVKTHNQKSLDEFWNWLEKDYKYNPKEVSENGFYFSIVSKSLVLHGFGEPFLDKKLIERIKICTKEKNTNLFFMYTCNNDCRKSKKKQWMLDLEFLSFH